MRPQKDGQPPPRTSASGIMGIMPGREQGLGQICCMGCVFNEFLCKDRSHCRQVDMGLNYSSVLVSAETFLELACYVPKGTLFIFISQCHKDNYRTHKYNIEKRSGIADSRY